MNSRGIISLIFLVMLLIPTESSAAVWTNEEEVSMKGVTYQAVPVTFSHCARISSVTTYHSNDDIRIPELSITGPNIKNGRSFPGISSETINDSIVAWTFHITHDEYWDDPLVLLPGTYFFNISNNSQWIATNEPDNFGKIRIAFDDRVCTSADYVKTANTSPFYSPGDILSEDHPWSDRGVMVFEVNQNDQSYSLIKVVQIEFMFNPERMDGLVGRLAWVLDHDEDLTPFKMSWNRTEEVSFGLIGQKAGTGESKKGPSGVTPEDINQRFKDYEYPPTIR